MRGCAVTATTTTILLATANQRPPLRYYESKLTLLLRGAFGGNSRTTAIVTCRSDDAHADETLQALRFGERCQSVSNAARQATSSVAGARAAIEAAVAACKAQVKSLEERGKQALPAYAGLVKKLATMEERMAQLARLSGAGK